MEENIVTITIDNLTRYDSLNIKINKFSFKFYNSENTHIMAYNILKGIHEILLSDSHANTNYGYCIATFIPYSINFQIPKLQ